MSRKNQNRRPSRPTTCETCGARNSFIETMPPISRYTAPSLYCTKCRANAAASIAAAQKARTAASEAFAEQMKENALQTADTRLERKLTTSDGPVRQHRPSAQDLWQDLRPDLRQGPSEDVPQPPHLRRAATPAPPPCTVCKMLPSSCTTVVDNNHHHHTLNLCQVCTLILTTRTQDIYNKDGNYSRTTLALCPSCNIQHVPAHRDLSPKRVCYNCIEDMLAAIGRIIPRTKEENRTDRAVYLLNPDTACQRCSNDPAAAGTSPSTCLLCRIEHDLLPEQDFPWENRSTTSNRDCASCPSKTGTAQAVAKHRPAENSRVCSTCVRISLHHPLRDRKSGLPLTILHCLGCWNPILRSEYNPTTPLCHPCIQKEITAWETLGVLYNYLHEVLDTPAGEEPAPPPENITRWLRPDSLTPRQDARSDRRITPELSMEICREYIYQVRELPELAIRFRTSPEAVLNVLNGRTYGKHTAGHRPLTIRPQPKRINTKPKTQTKNPSPQNHHEDSQEAGAPKPEPRYITVTRLKGQFGWTESLITKHLGQHDQQAPNPHYRSAPPMRLFNIDRVNNTQARNAGLQQKLQTNLDNRRDRQQVSYTNIIKRRQQLLRETAALRPVFIQTVHETAEELMETATKERKSFLKSVLRYEDYDQPFNNGGPAAQSRAVAMVRHEYTNYEELLATMPESRNAVTNTLIYLTVKTSVNELIATHIPDLAEACQVQIQEARNQAIESLELSQTPDYTSQQENPAALLSWLDPAATAAALQQTGQPV